MASGCRAEELAAKLPAASGRKNELDIHGGWVMNSFEQLVDVHDALQGKYRGAKGDVVGFWARAEAGSPKLSLRFSFHRIAPIVKRFQSRCAVEGIVGATINRVLLKMEQAPATGENLGCA
jgi:hypothetical protein